MCLAVFGSIKQGLCLFLEHVNFVFEEADLILEVCLVQLVDIDDVVVAVLTNRTPEANARRAVLAESFHFVSRMVQTKEGSLHLGGLDHRLVVCTS